MTVPGEDSSSGCQEVQTDGLTPSPVAPNGNPSHAEVADLIALVRRVVRSRMQDPDAADDIVQETLTRLLAARSRLDDRAAGPYAIVTARNLVVSRWQKNETGKRHEHKLVDPRSTTAPDDALVEREEADAVRAALERLSVRERDVLLAHEVNGQATGALAQDLGSTPGAVAAQLARARAKLRVEFLLELHGDPPQSLCRPVLLSLSAGDRRRQSELDAGYHLLDCDFCAALSEPLFDRRSNAKADEVRTPVRKDADIVIARQRGRELAVRAGFSITDATLIATAISEMARNIVRFARRGTMTMTLLKEGNDIGLLVVAQDVGPGIADIDLAMTEGYTTYGGMGLGLPGSMKLMDEFDVSSELGRGTTVSMTKWKRR